MGFVEQHRRHPGEFGIGQNGGDKNCLGHHHDPRGGAAFAVQPGQIADGLPGRFTEQFGHALGGGACGDPARAEHDHRARAPDLRDHRRGNRSGLASARRRNQDGRRGHRQSSQQVIEYGVDRQFGHNRAHKRWPGKARTGFGVHGGSAISEHACCLIGCPAGCIRSRSPLARLHSRPRAIPCRAFPTSVPSIRSRPCRCNGRQSDKRDRAKPVPA